MIVVKISFSFVLFLYFIFYPILLLNIFLNHPSLTHIRETAKEINSIVRQLIKNESTKTIDNNSIQRYFFKRIKKTHKSCIFSLPDLTITKMVEVLKTQIQSGGSPSRIIALGWVHHLFECLQEKVIY